MTAPALRRETSTDVPSAIERVFQELFAASAPSERPVLERIGARLDALYGNLNYSLGKDTSVWRGFLMALAASAVAVERAGNLRTYLPGLGKRLAAAKRYAAKVASSIKECTALAASAGAVLPDSLVSLADALDAASWEVNLSGTEDVQVALQSSRKFSAAAVFVRLLDTRLAELDMRLTSSELAHVVPAVFPGWDPVGHYTQQDLHDIATRMVLDARRPIARVRGRHSRAN